MKNKGLEKDIVYGVFSVISGMAVGITWGIRAILAFFNADKNGFAAPILILGAILSFLCFMTGFMVFVRMAKYKRYSMKIANAERFRIPALAVILKKSENAVFSELCRMVSAGYFGKAEIDMVRKELVIDKNSEPLDIPDAELQTMYKQHRKLPVLPFTAAITTICAFWLYGYGSSASLITGSAVGLFVLIAVYRFFPAPAYFTEVAAPPPKPTPLTKTGNEELDILLGGMNEADTEFLRIQRIVKKTPFGEIVAELSRLLGEISAQVTNHPDKVRQLRQFSTYYLPTTVRLAQSYEELFAIPDKGENVALSIKKIENMGKKIVEVFKREYDMLFDDKAMDISAEIAVMESMIDESKADVSPFDGEK